MADALIVDDDADTRASLRFILEEEQYTVFEAPDGASALERLRTHPSPLVVLLDWQMPGIDGFQVLQALVGDIPLTHRHAFILLTAASISATQPLPPFPPEMFVHVMRKPFDLDALLLAVGEAAARIGAG